MINSFENILDFYADERFGPILCTVNPMTMGTLRVGAHVDMSTATVAVSLKKLGIFADAWGFGAAYSDFAAARYSAVGEAIERYCGNQGCYETTIKCSILELDKLNIKHPTISELTPFSKEQFNTQGFPFKQLSNADEISWVKIGNSKNFVIPTDWCFLNSRTQIANFGKKYSDNAYWPVSPSGVAFYSGKDALHRATFSAFFEVVERDAVMKWWYKNPNSGYKVDKVTLGDLYAKRCEDLEKDNFIVLTFSLVSSAVVPVAVVIIIDKKYDVIGFGSAASFFFKDAANKALTESLQVLSFSVDLLDEESAFWSNAKKERSCEWNFRKDRTYLDEVSSAWKNVNSFERHALVWVDKRIHSFLGNYLKNAVEFKNDDRSLVYIEGSILDSFSNFNSFSIDITTTDISSMGGKVVRVVVPSSCPNYPRAYLPEGKLGCASKVPPIPTF